MDVEGEDVSRKLHVKFVTKLDSPFKVPATSVVIPSDVTRLGLSSIVNSLLDSGKLFYLCSSLIFVRDFSFFDFAGACWSRL